MFLNLGNLVEVLLMLSNVLGAGKEVLTKGGGQEAISQSITSALSKFIRCKHNTRRINYQEHREVF
jgi:hypothetical protein